ncbi:hypothetical protein [Cupriavidus campinensis]
MGGNVEIQIGAKLDQGDIDKALAVLTRQLNNLGQAIAQQNRVKFNPIDKSTLTDLQKVTAQFESLKKISGGLSQRLKATGQGGAGFFDIDWTKMYDDAGVRARQMRKAFEYVSAGTGAGFYSPAAPGGGGARPPSPPPPLPQPSPGTAWGRRVASSGLRAMGPAGGVADEALSAGLSGGAMAGLAGLAGGLLALGIGKAIGAVKEKIGAAQNDLIGYDTLKRTLGDVNVSFDALQRSLHAASDGIDVTYQEAQKLGTEFAKISGSNDAKSLAEEVLNGGGFGRSFGVDPGQSNAFFAQMRQSGVTHSPDDSRRLALDIGEAIAKSGAFAKADEMMQAVASYTAQQTRMGLTPGNATGFAGALTGLVGSHTPGLDPAGAANLLSRVNSSFAAGGNAGEAGQNYLYMTLGKQRGLNPIAARMLMEQGAFGTGAGTFGAGSLFQRWAQQNGVAVPGAVGSSETNLDSTLKSLRQNYANPWLRLDAMSNMFGINHNQAMALDAINPQQLGGLQRALSASGVDLSKMSSTGISALAQIASGGRGVLNSQTKDLWGQLSPDEAKRLDAAGKGGDEELRKALLELTAKHGQESTEGERTRKSIQDMDKNFMDAAGKMVGSLNDMRDVMLAVFGRRGMRTAADAHKAVIEGQRQDVADRYNERMKKAQASGSMSVDEYGRTLPGQEATMKAAQAEMNAAKAERDKALREIEAGDTPASSGQGANSAALPAWASQSASFPGASPAVAGRGPRNLRNNNPGNIEYGPLALSLGATGSDGRFAIFPDQKTGSAALDALLQRYGKQGLNTTAGIIGKWAPPSENNTSSYAASVAKALGVGVNDKLDLSDPAVRAKLGAEIARFEGAASAFTHPLPAGGSSRAGQSGSQDFNFTHEVVLRDTKGQQVAPASVVSTRVGAPTAFGSAN